MGKDLLYKKLESFIYVSQTIVKVARALKETTNCDGINVYQGNGKETFD